MSVDPVKVVIIPHKHIRGTAAEWTTANRCLLKGQIGVQTSDNPTTEPQKTKIGDGATLWNDLPFAGGGENNTASNVGTGVEVFKLKVVADLQFRKLNAGSARLDLTQNTNDITIDVVINDAGITINDLWSASKIQSQIDSATPPDASETVKGIIEIATQAEVNTGTDDLRAITPLKYITHFNANKGEVNTASNVGAGDGWFKTKTGVDLKFKSIISASARLSVVSNVDDLTLDVVINDAGITVNDLWSASKIQTRIDEATTGLLDFKGGYNAATNTPDLDTAPAGIKTGDTYVVTTNGNFFTEAVQVGDMLIAEQDDPTLLTHWTRVNKNIPDIVDASETQKGIIELATQAETDTGTDDLRAVTPLKLKVNIATYNFLQNIVEDLTPQLGGDLDINGKKITASAGNIVLDNTNVTGKIQLQLGTDTSATAFEVLNDSSVVKFKVDATGVVSISPNSASLLINNVGTSPRIFSASTITYQSNNTTLQHLFNNDASATGTQFNIASKGAPNGAVPLLVDHTTYGDLLKISIGATDTTLTTTSTVAIGHAAPLAKLDVLDDTLAQLRLTHTFNTDYVDFTVDTAGDLTIAPSGTNFTIEHAELRIIENNYDFIDCRRDSPNSLSIYKVYSTGDFTNTFQETNGYAWMNFFRTDDILIVNNPDITSTIQDNNGFKVTDGAILPHTTFYPGDDPNEIDLDFWTKIGGSSIAAETPIARIRAEVGGNRQGTLLFQTSADDLGFDTMNDALFIDSAGNSGFMTKTPDAIVDVFGETEQFRISFDETDHVSFTVDTNGDMAVAPTGDLVTFESGVTVEGRFTTDLTTTLANSATPTVVAGNLFITGGTITITDLTNGIVGQTISISAAHTITITHGTPIQLAGGGNFAMVAGNTLTLKMFILGVWEETGRK